MSDRRVVITGIGIVSPLAAGREATWERLLEGKSGAGRIDTFDPEDMPCKIAFQVPWVTGRGGGEGDPHAFDPAKFVSPKEMRRIDEFILYAIAAADEAVEDAGWKPEDDEGQERTGVLIGSGIGGLESIYKTAITLHESGPRKVSPFFIPAALINLASGQVSIRHKFKGPNHSVVTACAPGAHAIGDSARLIKYGDADMMIAGGGEATITPMTFAGFSSMRALSTRNDDPAGASRPFSSDRDGFVMGEGSGAVILEALEHAQARGAEILAEIVGYGLSADAHHITAPPPDGYGAQIAMRMALEDAGAASEDVDYVNAHGTSTIADAIETAAIKSVLGDHAYETVVGSTKSMTGHLLGAAAALEAITCIQACRTGKIPPTINFQGPDPDCDLEYAHGGMVERPVELALSNSFGFGGHNVCLAIRRWND